MRFASVRNEMITVSLISLEFVSEACPGIAVTGGSWR